MLRLFVLLAASSVLPDGISAGAGSPDPLKPPADWVALPAASSRGAYHLLRAWRERRPAADFPQTIDVVLEDFEGSLDAYDERSRGQIGAILGGPPPVHERIVICDGRPAFHVAYEAPYGTRTLHNEQIITEISGKKVVASYVRLAAQPDAAGASAALRTLCGPLDLPALLAPVSEPSASPAPEVR